MCVSFVAAQPYLGYGRVLIYRQKYRREGCTLGMYSWWWLALPLLHNTAFSLCTFFLWQIYRVRKIYNPFDRKAECCWIEHFIRLQMRPLPNTLRLNNPWPGLQVGRKLRRLSVCRESICNSRRLCILAFPQASCSTGEINTVGK